MRLIFEFFVFGSMLCVVVRALRENAGDHMIAVASSQALAQFQIKEE